MKPIHKLNNGRGATLCNTCSVIITTGLTKDLYCEKCKPKQHICTCERPDYYCDCLLYDEKVKEAKQELPIINGSYGCTIETKRQESFVERMIPLQLKYNLDKMKQKTLEEAAERIFPMFETDYFFNVPMQKRDGFIQGAKWQQERSYSEEDMKDAYIQGTLGLEYKKNFNESFYEWFNQFKKK